MASPPAGERWRSRHDGVRQRPSSGPLWDRGGLRSEVGYVGQSPKGMTPLTPLALKRSGAIRVPHSTSDATQRGRAVPARARAAGQKYQCVEIRWVAGIRVLDSMSSFLVKE